jgi:hypothetical protein
MAERDGRSPPLAPRDRASGAPVCDLATGTGFHLDVAPDNALDAFNHPYAYAAGREARAERTIVDG